MTGSLVAVGLGPGDSGLIPPETLAALEYATDGVGYTPYLVRLPTSAEGRLHPSDNRAEMACALQKAGCDANAWVVRYAAMAGQSVAKLAEVEARSLPYVSIILVHGRGRRP